MSGLAGGFIAGYAGLSARADLLDRINVFPVADSDTGTNLRISLAPLRSCDGDRQRVVGQLRRAATGNSGNIAAAFFGELLLAEGTEDLTAAVIRGREQAWRAVAEPKAGTMLSVFDCLADVLARQPLSAANCPTILAALQQAVLATTSVLPDLRAAEVIDAGALGMFVFFDGFFRHLTGQADDRRPLAELFPGRLAISATFYQETSDAYCVDAVIRPESGRTLAAGSLVGLGDSVVLLPGQEEVKLHIHTADPQGLRRRLGQFGEVLAWSDTSLHQIEEKTQVRPDNPGCLHIMTDAAGSLPREMARQYGISLLDSYIVAGDAARPESLCEPEEIYRRMRAGEKVTTAQASLVERQQQYRSVCEQYGPTLYLCVGSAYTGNYAAAAAWQKEHDREGLFEVVDTGAASGRLALIALLSARFARTARDAEAVRTRVRSLLDDCREFVFIDTLRYLVAGGRVSRAGGFFGDLLRMKPVITPTREGVRKLGVVRNRQAQSDFALNGLRREAAGGNVLILLQYSDNRDWVEGAIATEIRTLLPTAEIILVPLSLTSGVHMGPGTWSLAFAGVA
jgi:hypothetical protein